MNRRIKIGLLFILVVSMVSCPNDEDEEFRYAEPVQYLELYISFEEPKMVVYGQYLELVTLKRILETTPRFSLTYYKKAESSPSVDIGWYFSKNSNPFTKEYHRDLFEFMTSEIIFAEEISYLEIIWQNNLFFRKRTFEENKEIIEAISLAHFDASLFIDPLILLRWEMSSRADIIFPRKDIWRHSRGRPWDFSTAFKELKCDEQGILFELVSINDREIVY